MDFDEHNSYANFEIGDIVSESKYIIDPMRSPWVGIVVYIDKEYYELHSYLGQYEDLLGVYWFQPAKVETLPASVVRIVQKIPKQKKEHKELDKEE